MSTCGAAAIFNTFANILKIAAAHKEATQNNT
jgi:hypothetical protein